MLTPEQQELLAQLRSTCNRDQYLWISGYMQGLTHDGNVTVAPTSNLPAIDVYYATETGSSKALSLLVMKAFRTAGFKIKATSVNRLKIDKINPKNIAIFLVSTHGEGDPPESAIPFFEKIKAAQNSALKDLSYAVLGLGDKSYDIFCGAAIDLDKELSRLGGNRFQDNALFDVDYASYTMVWIDNTVKQVQLIFGTTQDTIVASHSNTPPNVNPPGLFMENTPAIMEVKTGKGYTRLEPVVGEITEIINLNDRGSNKETYHIEIAYAGDVTYTSGDAAGIVLSPDYTKGDDESRLYSIASSPTAHEGEVHLTMALATHMDKKGKIGYGLVSSYLSKLKKGDTINFYIHQNHIFNLPADDQDAIMIGPGTGIAPFRSFVYERLERGANGRNWLFFGDQYAHCDFLYQAEWQEHLATGILNRIDLAFSRNQNHKVYVQHKLKENASEVVKWLDNGAAFYVCGAKDPMSKDVEQTLLEIIAVEKSISAEAAEDYLAELEEQNRYVKDVY